MTVREAMTQLLEETSGIIYYTDVTERVGREVSRACVSKVAKELHLLGIPGAGGGYCRMTASGIPEVARFFAMDQKYANKARVIEMAVCAVNAMEGPLVAAMRNAEYQTGRVRELEKLHGIRPGSSKPVEDLADLMSEQTVRDTVHRLQELEDMLLNWSVNDTSEMLARRWTVYQRRWKGQR